MTSAVCTVAALLAATACSGDGDSAGGSDSVKTIAIAEIVTIPPIEQNVAAFKKELATLGYVEGQNVKYVVQNAQGQASAFSLVTRQIIQTDPDLIYALGTPLIVSIAQKAEAPVLFGIMTDPVGAKVIKDVDRPGTNVTGTSDYIPASVYFDAFAEVLPSARTIGFIGNPSESNTQSALRDFRDEAQKRDMEVRFAPVSDSSKVKLALQSLRGNVDVLTFPADNTVSAALKSVVKQATQMGMPVIASQTETASAGGLVGIGLDWAEAGRESAKQAAKILDGEASAKDLPVWFPTEGGTQILLNETTADDLNIDTSGLPSIYQRVP